MPIKKRETDPKRILKFSKENESGKREAKKRLNNFQPLRLAVSSKKSNPQFYEAINFILQEIRGDLEVGRFHFRKYLPALSCLVLNLLECNSRDSKRYLTYSRNRNEYRHGRYNPQNIGFDVFTSICSAFHKIGFTEQILGGYEKDGEVYRPRTRIRANKELLEFFSSEVVEQILRDDIVDQTEIIILRNRHKQDVEYHDNKRTKSMREFLTDFNDSLKSVSISSEGRIKSWFPFRRIFSMNSFDKGGRFFQHNLQSIPKKIRYTTTMDGSPTTELDFTATFTSIAYAKNGLSIPQDSYNISFEFPTNEIKGMDPRRAIKIAMNTLYNVKNNGANRAIRNALEEEAEDDELTEFEISDETIKAMKNQIFEYHSAIRAQMCNPEIGYELQFIESNIAEQVMKSFLKANKPLIPIHDSFVCCRKDASFLEFAMKEASREVLGVSLPFKKKF